MRGGRGGAGGDKAGKSDAGRKCFICGEKGHNKAACPKNTEQKKKPTF